MTFKALVLTSLFLFASTLLTFAQNLTVGTYNIRYANPNDAGNLWADRAPSVAALLRFHDFDVFGTQEGLKNQLDDISQALPAYARYGLGRDDGKEKGEHAAIYFKKDRFKLLNKGDFWLSETPDKPGKGWDATCCNRICSWVYLQDLQTKQKFYFFNAHYDHQGVQARQESSKLVLRKIKEIAKNEPAIFTGDLNGDHGSAWYQAIAQSGSLKDAYREVKFPYALSGTFNGFDTTTHRPGIIDHVFITDHFRVHRWGVLTDTYHGKFPSDHFPVLAELSLKGKK